MCREGRSDTAQIVRASPTAPRIPRVVGLHRPRARMGTKEVPAKGADMRRLFTLSLTVLLVMLLLPGTALAKKSKVDRPHLPTWAA
jgi:hypothetical protein